MKNYDLGFISNEDIFNHVKETVSKYRYNINLESFNSNIIDPIKLTFDSKIYKMSAYMWKIYVFGFFLLLINVDYLLVLYLKK